MLGTIMEIPGFTYGYLARGKATLLGRQKNDWGKWGGSMVSNVLSTIIFVLVGSNFIFYTSLYDKSKQTLFPTNQQQYYVSNLKNIDTSDVSNPLLKKQQGGMNDCKSKDKISNEEVAQLTLKCLKNSVPSEVPGIAFLSGGQTEIEATENLNLINKKNDTNYFKILIVAFISFAALILVLDTFKAQLSIIIPNIGNGGIIVTNSGTGFLAWDASDPNHISNPSCSTMSIIGGIEGLCNCQDENSYSLITGQSLNIALECSLKPYRVELNGNTLLISTF